MNILQKQIAEYILYIGKFSLEDRKNKLTEELAELIRGLAKDDKDNITEELADVTILLYEYITLANINSEVSNVIDVKLDRFWRILSNVEEND